MTTAVQPEPMYDGRFLISFPFPVVCHQIIKGALPSDDDDDDQTTYAQMSKLLSAQCCQASASIDSSGPCDDDLSSLCVNTNKFEPDTQLTFPGPFCHLNDKMAINDDFCNDANYYTCEGYLWQMGYDDSWAEFPPNCANVST